MSDTEFAPIADMLKNRGRNANQLPAKVVHFVPEERADQVLALDERIQKLRQAMPMIMFGAAVLIAFIAGVAL